MKDRSQFDSADCGRGIWTVIMLTAATLAPTACKKKIFVKSTAAYIIGPSNDIRKVSTDDKSGDHKGAIQASVLISTLVTEKKRKFCSGTLIAPEDGKNQLRVLTNHHCFAEVDDNGNVAPNWLPTACIDTEVVLGFTEGSTDSVVRIGCLPGSLRTDFEGDLAVFSLAASVPPAYAPLEIWSEDSVPAGRKALIVHYPDVDDHFARVNGTRAKLPLASITTDNCQTDGEFDESEWNFDQSLPYSFKHSCDLVHGSSGSALIDSDSKKILGVNWGGIKIDYEGTEVTTNVATGAQYVRAFLEKKTSEMQHQAANQRRNGPAGTLSAKERNQKKKPSMTQRMRGAFCGSVGGGAGHAAPIGIIMIFLAPLLFVRLGQRD